ncbi:hypothetical protein GLOIN_2v1764697 [Rhizophagus irregularis DAOM 181602=DAOM 197198]|uniref:Uncharacterized protein n=1 Tax=Rhizophagus irregularis (strain DAOM 181602 / DAOM 197198 / MUCL 43194) TaxID=747089 RepID=A0A2P4QRG7_RHIID|nr:hypothetical protein GLOIN_2v1764697 [Rhizophagus irregularis DAOM 181602=DAOM 197198]POG80246.1 hypothetical protein GLOIN_2v1764697 [Rhizophagus irregularis DAOM 181602=DAOM 197198]|eukprot:XP_025187112.1 hypothetical protein GLOIN_2v1764697 [Rhizophagus irregularis DAOM 181602=DAOM 197198]
MRENTRNSKVSSKNSNSSSSKTHKNNTEIIIEDDDYGNDDAPEIIEKDPPLESSTHKEPSTHKDISKITRSTEDAEGGDKDMPKRTIKTKSNNEEEEDDDDVEQDLVSHDQFEMLISLRSGGLPSAPKSKKWIDKVDLAVALRDVLINEGIENNGVDPDKFHYRSSFIQLENTGYLAFKKVKLPSSINNLPVIEQLIISLLRVEKTLYRMRKTRQEILFDKQGYIDCEDHHRAQ